MTLNKFLTEAVLRLVFFFSKTIGDVRVCRTLYDSKNIELRKGILFFMIFPLNKSHFNFCGELLLQKLKFHLKTYEGESFKN